MADFQKLIETSKELGLEVNPGKCEIFCTNPESRQQIQESFKTIAPQIKILDEESRTLLGSPVLPPSEDLILQEKLSDLQRMSERLEELDTHDALFLLRHCFSITRLTYFLQCAPCYKSAILEYDEVIKETLQKKC